MSIIAIGFQRTFQLGHVSFKQGTVQVCIYLTGSMMQAQPLVVAEGPCFPGLAP